MSERMQFILENEKAGAWIFRLVLLVGMLWASNNFVSKASYEVDKRDADGRREAVISGLGKLNESLIRLDEKMANDQRQDVALKDHEQRLRALEQHR